MKRTWMYGLILALFVGCLMLWTPWVAASKAQPAWTLTITVDGHQRLEDASGHWIEFGWKFAENREAQTCELYFVIYRASHYFCIIYDLVCPERTTPESALCAPWDDFGWNGELTLKDFAAFQRAMTGPREQEFHEPGQ